MKRVFSVDGGIWAWGTVTAILGAVVVFIILTGWPSDVYGRIKDAATAVGAVVAASALAWSHFFQTGGRRDETAKLDTLLKNVAELSRRIEAK